MILTKQHYVVHEALFFSRRIGKPLLPAVRAASDDAQLFTERLYWELTGKFHYNLVFSMSYLITVPVPFTSYPFLAVLPVSLSA